MQQKEDSIVEEQERPFHSVLSAKQLSLEQTGTSESVRQDKREATHTFRGKANVEHFFHRFITIATNPYY